MNPHLTGRPYTAFPAARKEKQPPARFSRGAGVTAVPVREEHPQIPIPDGPLLGSAAAAWPSKAKPTQVPAPTYSLFVPT